MAKKKGKTRNKGAKPLRKALSSAIIAGAVLVPASYASGKEAPATQTIVQRVATIRAALSKRFAGHDIAGENAGRPSYEEAELGQWANWGNWGNWANWNNWNNFANWGNWANQWGNWGNF